MQADSQVESIRQHFQEESLDYVCKLQEIQERKKFDCVEPVSVRKCIITHTTPGGQYINSFLILFAQPTVGWMSFG